MFYVLSVLSCVFVCMMCFGVYYVCVGQVAWNKTWWWWWCICSTDRPVCRWSLFVAHSLASRLCLGDTACRLRLYRRPTVDLLPVSWRVVLDVLLRLRTTAVSSGNPIHSTTIDWLRWLSHCTALSLDVVHKRCICGSIPCNMQLLKPCSQRPIRLSSTQLN